MKRLVSVVSAIALCLSLAACAPATQTAAPAPAPAPAATPTPTPAPEPKVEAPAPAADTKEEAPAPAAAKKTSDWTLAYICKDLSQQWFISESGQMLETAKKLGAKDVIMCDAGMNPEKYMTHLDNMIAQKVDLIFVCPPDQQLSQITVDRCAAAGIPVIAIDDALIDASGKAIAPVVELSAFDVGRQQGDWLADTYAKEYATKDVSEVGYMVMTMNEVSSCVPRADGAKKAFTDKVTTLPAGNIVNANYDGTPEKGFEVAAATITANPKIKYWLITAPNDEGAMGATRALEQAGKDKNSAVVGCGAYHAKDEFKKEYSAMKAAVFFDARVAGETVTQEAIGLLKDGTEMCKDFKKDDQKFGRRPFGGVLVTKENYVAVMGDAAK